jgi:cell wall-associated NlpC family hydrolase
MSVVLGASDFRNLISRLDMMRRVGRNDAAVVASVKSARERIETAKESLETRRAEQMVLRDSAAQKRAAVDRALTKQAAYLATLDATLKKLIAEERARQQRLAAEAAARAAANNRGRADPNRPFDPAALGAPHPEVVQKALPFVGVVPYVWGGTSPAGFDCSGLTQWCYAAIGITIPRNSRRQFLFGSYIPPARTDVLAPGDLVFFGRDGDPGRVHHVGIYKGDGQFIHAPQTGMRVSITYLSSRTDYVGATRP